MKEPIIHSHLSDKLPKNHPLAYESVYCKKCDETLHCGSNECMQTWLETERGNFCVNCYPITELLTPPGDVCDICD